VLSPFDVVVIFVVVGPGRGRDDGVVDVVVMFVVFVVLGMLLLLL